MLMQFSNAFTPAVIANTTLQERPARAKRSSSSSRGDNDADTSTQKMTPLPFGFEPSEHDVVCGKGKDAYDHAGNKRFREVIEDNVHTYAAATNKVHKTLIVNGIVDTIVSRCPQGGGFVRQDDNGQWLEVGSQLAKEKVSHTIRERLLYDDTEKRDARRKTRAKNKALRKARRELEKKQLPTSYTSLRDFASTMALPAVVVPDGVSSAQETPPPRLVPRRESLDWFSPCDILHLTSIPITDEHMMFDSDNKNESHAKKSL